MNFIDLKREVLSVTHNDITYTKEVYKSTSLITGVSDAAHPAWTSTQEYLTGEYVVVPELKAIYRSTSTNTDKFPLEYLGSDWVFWGFINSYNMFASDENIGSHTTGEDIVITLDFSQMNTLALLDIEFEGSMNITQTNNLDESEVYNKDISSRDISCTDFAEYCYKDIKQRKKSL